MSLSERKGRAVAGSATSAVIAILAAASIVHGAEPMRITRNIKLDKDAVLTSPLVIEADGITIDGNGATIQGPGKAGDLSSFVGEGVLAENRSKVTIRNLKVRGFTSGLRATDGREWIIENCDFSDNYHDPSYGWGDGERVGGIILTRMHKCIIRKNKANRVWNGLDLWESHDNTIEHNDFSHCSNVCLKMWLACRNQVRDNNLSYGLRISPGEVHARDSTCVLLETGSNDNLFERNDITHGGDGVFIRVLNGWCSTGNVFIENDCSYANNNGFEAWSPGNTYIRNKANHCSYGFWLGGSDRTVLIGNEAAYNGRPDGFHNAPEPDFVHGGIVIVHGSGTHTIIEDNYCHHNNGAGIVFRGDLATRGAKWKMHHLIVQNNRLENNRWGLFARFTDWLDLAGNTYANNEQDELLEDVTHLSRRPADPQGKPAPKVKITGPERVTVGQPVVFEAAAIDASGRTLHYRWDIGGKEYTTQRVEHVFTEPGFYRAGVTVHNGHLAGLDGLDVYVTRAAGDASPGAIANAPQYDELTDSASSRWTWSMGNNADKRGKVIITDDPECLVGKRSLRFRPDPYKGSDVAIACNARSNEGWKLDGAKYLSFWIKWANPNNGGFQGPTPIVRLHRGKAAFTYTPAFNGMPRNLLGDLPYSEARHGWLYVRVALDGEPGVEPAARQWIRMESLEGAKPPHFDRDLQFTTVETTVETQGASAMTSDGKRLYCAVNESDAVFASEDGRDWKPLPRPSTLGGAGPDWINGMLCYDAANHRLILRRRAKEKDAFDHDQPRLIAFDIEKSQWSWLPTITAMGHGCVVVGEHLFGIAHAIAGNYGGPIDRVNLANPGPLDERTVLAPVVGKDAWWFSRAAQLACVDGKIYATKNDWQTPRPEKADEIGDRLLVFDPAEYRASSFAGGNRWDSKNWKEARTPVKDLGPLPFEIGHGSALVALPPNWCERVGPRGGLFLLAGCSPSNHEGYGPPSAQYAIYDIATNTFTTGNLPDITGTGSSATLHRGKLYIKRGGINHAPSNREMWIVEPVPPEKAQAMASRTGRERMSLERVDGLSIQFDSMGHEPFDVWIDGLSIE
ncbi:MAG TPA: right-handed parallel beta-helix repeat-containing protein [Phycisphaerae bacterium]|nr:right-handed parallel beta-helix repeat-containing protein [Phycisphaerae bacterium]HPP25335.1 right-handed parallel beta-helix repeat-containing protein [Phycisphaerae bacterium]HPU24638.1 right-handed parallel beta-helix repeat-containing protein [Phycisphaerae bacterium]HPZ96542.1 right-handed parallel beta-helix repeat-containing protein [Phycisphaerae bacterium]